MKNLAWLSVSLVVIWTDQISKAWANRVLGGGETITIFKGFDFSLAYNTGAAFSLFHNAAGWQRYFFVIVAIVMSIILLVWLRGLTRNQNITGFAIALVLGGAWGNLIDRATYGYVVDFISFYYQRWYFPTFNVADIAICTGAFILVLVSFYEEHSNNKSPKSL